MLAQTLQQPMQAFNSAISGRRTLTNPMVRMPLRPQFPDFFRFDHNRTNQSERDALLYKIETALAHFGDNLSTIQHITLAYPHKDPVLMPAHHNTAHMAAIRMRDVLLHAAPHIQWCLANAIVEVRHLDRSSDQSIRHTLTARQEYTLRPDIQTTRLPWLEGTQGPHYTIMVDSYIEQGTTLMNMASMLEANGLTVIGANVQTDWMDTLNLRQKTSNAAISQYPHGCPDYTHPKGTQTRAEQLSHVFARSANSSRGFRLLRPHKSPRLTPEMCLAKFDEALAPHGLHHTTLTDGECVKIIKSLSGQLRSDTVCDYNYSHFNDLLKDLKPLPAGQSHPVRKRRYDHNF